MIEAEAALSADTRVQDGALRDRIRAERDQNKREINGDPDLSRAQKAELSGIEDRVALARLRKVNIDEAQRFLEEETALQRGQLESGRDLAQSQADLADTNAQRRAAALRILDLQYQIERAELEAVVASKTATENQKKIAQARLDILGRLQASDQAGVERQFEGSAARYQREIYGDINEQLEDIQVQGLRDLTDELTKAAEGALGLKGALGGVVSELIRVGIERAVIAPIADALFGASGAGGGAVGSFIGSLFGRASGGYVGPGQTVRVNEGRGGMELLRMGSQGGTVIPLGQTKAAVPQRGGDRNFYINVSADNSVTPAGFARDLSKRILDQAQRMDAQTAGAIVKNMPQRMAQYQTDGT